jgi:hypothetical protein
LPEGRKVCVESRCLQIRQLSKPGVIALAPSQQTDQPADLPINRQRFNLSFALAENNAYGLPAKAPQPETRLDKRPLPAALNLS